MIFIDKHFLYLLLILPIIGLLFFLMIHYRQKKLFQVFDKTILSYLASSHSRLKKIIKMVLALLSLALMILALARPVLKDKTEIEKTEGIEMMLLVDISQSMRTQDVHPDRLSLLKIQFSRLLNTMKKNHRVGLIAFAGSSFLLSPLTSDMNLILMYLDSLSTDLVTSQGTHFKGALLMAGQSFESGSTHQAEKVIIIASDGEDNEAGALEQARALRQKGIRIFTLGVGTKDGGRIPLKTGGYLKDPSSNKEVQSQFKGRLLKELAKIGKGGFYHVQALSQVSEKLQQDLMVLKHHMFEEKRVQGQTELFQYFLIGALFFALSCWLLRERKSLF